MLSLKDIKYEVISQDDFISALSAYPKNDHVTFDYETYNDIHGDRAVEPWDENTHPFMFSVCSLSDPENTLKVFNFRDLTSEQKTALEHFLTTREVWAFNCKFEAAVTWKLLGKFIQFQDVQCLYKVSGQFVDGLSLKKGTASLLNVPEWADDTWETLKVLRAIVTRVQKIYVNMGKADAWIDAYLEGNVRRIYELVDQKAQSSEKTTKDEAIFIAALLLIKPHLTHSTVLNALTKSKMNADHVNLTYVPQEIVERYCVYDAYATAYNHQKLHKSCKKQYPIYLRQAWLATIMEVYGMTRDLGRERELEAYYQEQILFYMKEILKIPEFTEMLVIKYKEQRENPETGRLKQFPCTRLGFELEDHRIVEEATDYDVLKGYWNYNSNHINSVKIFYDILFSSDMAKSAVVAYHIKKYLDQLEGFSEVIDGQEISIAKKVKWHNIAEIYQQAVEHIQSRLKAAKRAEYGKWDTARNTLEKTFQEAISLQIAPPSQERAKIVDIDDIRVSLKKENVEILFNALTDCADINPDDPLDTFPWEMKLVFCCKVIKKLDKALTSWVQGKVGRDCVRKCQFGKSLLDVPVRTGSGTDHLFQTSFNDCSAETKRWKSPIHAIPRGSELSEMIVPRYEDSILVHYDYCWHKDTRIMTSAGRIYTIEDLYIRSIDGHNTPWRLLSYDSSCKCDTPGTIKEIRRVRFEHTLMEITLDNGYSLMMTREHNLYLEGYIKTEACNLKVGDALLTSVLCKTPSIIKHIDVIPYGDWVYTVEIVEDHHNYFVMAASDNSKMVLSSNSQAEVRVVAALAQEKDLINLFKENPKADIHRLMASRVWNKKPEDVSGEERRASKAVTFGLLYGQNTESLANQHFKGNVTTAKDVVSRFYAAYPEILKWCNERHAQVDRNGYVETLFGDKIYIESKSKGERHRRSQNYPVQSTSSNMAGYGIWGVWEHCQSEGIEAIPQCFIHDSSDWDVRLRDLVRFIQAVNKCAVDDISAEFGIPMKIDFEIGINLNFTMHIENAKFEGNGVEFAFKCPEIFYKPLIKRLQISYTVEGEVTEVKTEIESWANLFVTKRPYSMYLNRPIKVYEGSLGLKPK